MKDVLYLKNTDKIGSTAMCIALEIMRMFRAAVIEFIVRQG